MKTKISTITMTPQILSLIIAVKSYQKYIISDFIFKNPSFFFKKEEISESNVSKFDWYEKTFEYFKSLELPEGLMKNKRCFNKIIENGDWYIEKFSNMPSSEFRNYIFSF